VLDDSVRVCVCACACVDGWIVPARSDCANACEFNAMVNESIIMELLPWSLPSVMIEILPWSMTAVMSFLPTLLHPEQKI
jgi:hypothetical protein